MKLPLITVAFLAGLVAASHGHFPPPFGEGQLYEDIQYFMDMIPMEDVVSIVLEYAGDDAEFQELLAYFETDEFKQVLKEVEAIAEFHDFTDYLEKSGVHINQGINKLNEAVGIPPYKPTVFAKGITGGLKGLFEDVKSLVNYDNFIHGYVYKMRISDAFRGFVAHLKSKENQQFVNALYSSQKFIHFRAMLVGKGLDIALVEDVIFTVLGIDFPVFEMPPVMKPPVKCVH